MRKWIYNSWNAVFDHNLSPLKNIPDIGVRHVVLQVLAWMWVIAFSLAIGSFSGFLWSAIGHIALITALTVTVATYRVAEKKPQIFIDWGYNPMPNPGRRIDGEHE
jgi:hypothetical protein|tara:strand:- start:344 stop:661 length:318 start_codon:yes stop_codon:yes gene_type:complete